MDSASGASPPFVHFVRVGWGDCDPARIAFTGRLAAFALEAIDAWWEHVESLDLPRAFGVQPPRAPAMQPWGLRVGYVFELYAAWVLETPYNSFATS